MKPGLMAASLLALAACSKPNNLLNEEPVAAAAPAPGEPAGPPPDVSRLPAGHYVIDKTHTSVVFSVDHLGFSNYTASFDVIDAVMELDPKNPSAARLTATIPLASLDLPAPPDGFLNDLLGPQWFDAAKFPEIKFTSTTVTPVNATTADVAGYMSLHGVNQPVTMRVMFNGGYAGHTMDPNARLGFSAKGSLKRSLFGIEMGIPAPGSNMGVGDEVRFAIETEFSGPALASATAPSIPPAPAPASNQPATP
jgi:polyisoprenoid-binding protein YceI